MVVRLNLILLTWTLIGVVLFTQSAKADEVNSHIANIHTDMETRRGHTTIQNHYAPSTKEGREFVAPARVSHGVDMRVLPSLPNYDYDLSYTPGSMDVAIEKDILENQTTDYVVESSWQKIKRDINSDSRAGAETVKIPSRLLRPSR